MRRHRVPDSASAKRRSAIFNRRAGRADEPIGPRADIGGRRDTCSHRRPQQAVPLRALGLIALICPGGEPSQARLLRGPLEPTTMQCVRSVAAGSTMICATGARRRYR